MKAAHNNAIGPQVRQNKPNKRKLAPWLVLATLFSSLQAATQYLAHVFNYSSALGASFYGLYWPWSMLNWWNNWSTLYPHFFATAANIAYLSVATGLLATALSNRFKVNSSKANPYLHGSARWANKEDLLHAGLLNQDQGVYVGAWVDEKGLLQYLRHNGPEHVLTYAPTRSGKGVGLVLPTLLSWPHSVVITDLKGELWAMTAGWRKLHAKNKVIRFEPAISFGSACWNPLDEIRIGTDYEVGDVQNLAMLIVDPEGKGLESHWQKTSQALLVGFILHAIYKLKDGGQAATLPNIDRMLVDPNIAISDLLTEMTQYKHNDSFNHPVVNAAARDMMDRPEEEAGSVLSTLKSYLSLYRDPVVAKNISSSDFCIKDLMRHEDPVSLYIITQPSDKARLQPLVRVMLNLVVRLLADKMEFERIGTELKIKQIYKHRLLGMIDEFPSLGKLDILQESLAFVAGYGIKFYLICQDINQLKSRERGYGPDESISSNCHIQNAYPPNRVETAEHLSKLSGQTTVIKEQISVSGKRASLMLGQASKTLQEIQRPLLTIDECLRMPGPKKNAQGQIEKAGDMIIYVAGYPAIYGKQPLYFQDPVFMARAAISAPELGDTLRQKLKPEEKISL